MRRRKLNEEYSFIWLVIGVVYLIIAVFPDIISWLSEKMGTVLPINTLFFLAICLILLLCLYFSLKISNLYNRVKTLTQKVSILEAELKKKEKVK